MSWARGKSSGWAAFDLKQRQKEDIECETDKDPFPPLSTTLPSLSPCKNFERTNSPPKRSFSSAVLTQADFPTLLGDSRENCSTEVSESDTLDREKLSEFLIWADDGLLEDILGAVSNNTEQASALLKAMISNDTNEKINDIGLAQFCPSNRSSCDKRMDERISDTMDVASICSTSYECLEGNDSSSNKNHNHLLKLSDSIVNVGGGLKYALIEPEWEEEEDIYLSHRKDALAMMRSASQRSRAAANAFLRGDHISARRHSLKSREEWLEAERLNARAAKEILAIRNNKNDAWKLDLHGLHAAEAVQALHEHLQKIETQVPSNRSVSPIKDKQSTSRSKPTSLQVITGIGTHSRGQAAIPTAVTSFLSENGYRFEEQRPGVISVWPKFCR